MQISYDSRPQNQYQELINHNFNPITIIKCHSSIFIPLKSLGKSMHTETLNITQWKNMTLYLQYNLICSTFTIIGHGDSVVNKNDTASMRAQEELNKRLIVKQAEFDLELKQKYSGDAFYIGQKPDPQIKQIKCPPFEFLNCAHDEIAVGFCILGTLNIKNGDIKLMKEHYDLVDNSIQYSGTIKAIYEIDKKIVEKNVGVFAEHLHNYLDNSNQNNFSEFKGFIINLAAKWSSAELAAIPFVY
jgi:hypothetical protein